MNFELFAHYFANSPPLFYTCVFIFGLIIGSFLNVVIHRLPIMMEYQWANEAKYIINLLNNQQSLIQPQAEIVDTSKQTNEQSKEKEAEKFNLMWPQSHCPQCKKNINSWENIPIFSYLFLKGKCSQCELSISARYPLVEFITAILSLVVAIHFGVTSATFAALILTWFLIALTLIDFDTHLLPDQIVFPLLWLGFIVNLNEIYVPLEEAVMGAILGYLSLWSVYWLFKIITGKEGMGYGDFKLLAALGAWLGYKSILSVILLSSLAGAAIGVTLILVQGRGKQIPIAFGPYLALGGWITLVFKESLSKNLNFLL